jgi:hypothetical protein
MSAGPWTFYEKASEYLQQAQYGKLSTATVKFALFLSSSNAGTLTNSIFGNLTNEHSGANGYTAGGASVANKSVSRTGGVTKFSGDPVEWTASGGSMVARRVVAYVDATIDGQVKPLIATALLDDTPADVTVTAGNKLTISPNVADSCFFITKRSTD